MATTQTAIREWLEEAKKRKATHLLVVCDTFYWEDYPVFVLADESVAQKAEEHHLQNMEKVMECYDLSVDWESQLAEYRAWHGWHPQVSAD
jgi:hypothetical protein